MTSTTRSGKQNVTPLLDLKGRKLIAIEKIDINSEPAQRIQQKLGLSAAVVKKITAARKRKKLRTTDDLAFVLTAAEQRTVAPQLNSMLFQFTDQVEVLRAHIAGDRVFSYKPYQVTIGFKPPTGGRAVMAAITVHWRGKPFVFQHLITEADNKAGEVTVYFDEQYALPPGLVRLHIAVYDSLGGADNFELQDWVYPSNPFSLFLSPANRSIFNGSVRPDWTGSSWNTGINLTFVNGDNTTVTLQRNVTWKFWDGGVGNTLVEQGTFNWHETITVGPFGSYGGWVSFNSPSGSGIFNRYEGQEDMTIEIIFRKTNNTEVRSTITCRIMAGFGINIILVGTFTTAERQGIANGILDARDVYENHGLTFASEQWWEISNAQAGGYTMLGDEDEWEDLLDDWTVDNNSVDCFVTRSLWGGFAGFSPIPGPDGKDGSCENDGLAVDNSMQCFAHELGHYMGGIEHADSEGRGNVMHSICGGRNFTYGQYKQFFDHGWTRIVR